MVLPFLPRYLERITRDSAKNFGPKQAFYLVVGFLLSVAIGIADYRAGPGTSFLIVYFFPVIWVNWKVGWRQAMALACINIVVWVLLANFTQPGPYHSWPPFWNGVRAMMYLAVSYVLCSLKGMGELEKKWAFEDPLTGLSNRRAFFQWAQREIARAKRQGSILSVALVDVDDFKQINDLWGHDQGDQVLVWIGKTLQTHLRSTDILARLGGDEMAVLLSDSGAESAEAIMRKVHESFQNSTEELGVAISVSIGVATFQTLPATVEDMLRAADRQMYRVKLTGKNNIEFDVISEKVLVHAHRKR